MYLWKTFRTTFWSYEVHSCSCIGGQFVQDSGLRSMQQYLMCAADHWFKRSPWLVANSQQQQCMLLMIYASIDSLSHSIYYPIISSLSPSSSGKNASTNTHVNKWTNDPTISSFLVFLRWASPQSQPACVSLQSKCATYSEWAWTSSQRTSKLHRMSLKSWFCRQYQKSTGQDVIGNKKQMLQLRCEAFHIWTIMYDFPYI